LKAVLFHATEMSTSERNARLAFQLEAHLGVLIGERRRERRWTLRDLADRSGVSITRLHDIEHGRSASLVTYAAIAAALHLELQLDLADPRRRLAQVRNEDPVHAAMGEAIAERMAANGFVVAIDEPYQHFQFAGRADVLAWDVDVRHLLHVENRTRFPNIQDAIGSYNAKRRYLPGVIAERLGRRGGFESVTNVIAGLWSSEVIHAVRLHAATFDAVCPDPADGFAAWWGGHMPAAGVTSTIVVLDPGRLMTRQRRWAPIGPATRPRHRGYAAASTALSREGASRS
jgi:transcriptional regulator with XRE-family HTH domain